MTLSFSWILPIILFIAPGIHFFDNLGSDSPLLVHAYSKLYASINSCTSSSSSNSFQLNDIYLNCGSSSCSWGSNALVEGMFTIGENGLETQYPNMTIDAWGSSSYQDVFDICGGNTTDYRTSQYQYLYQAYSHTDKCPESGIYNFSTYVQLPRPSSWKAIFTRKFSSNVSAYLDFDGGEEYQCYIAVTSYYVPSTSSTSSASGEDDHDHDDHKDGYDWNDTSWYSSYITSGAILVIGGGSMFYGVLRHKRRQVRTLDSYDSGMSDHDGGCPQSEVASHFELMERRG